MEQNEDWGAKGEELLGSPGLLGVTLINKNEGHRCSSPEVLKGDSRAQLPVCNRCACGGEVKWGEAKLRGVSPEAQRIWAPLFTPASGRARPRWWS